MKIKIIKFVLRNNNKCFKPSKFYFFILSTHKNISYNIENKYFPIETNLNLFFILKNKVCRLNIF